AAGTFLVRRAGKLDREVKDEFGRLNARVTEDITNQTLIRVFAKEGDRAAAFRRAAGEYKAKALRLSLFNSLSFTSMDVVLGFVLP
ncbi:hypothetical protein RSW31_25400, partial [Escherichia coli]|uniref:hypothetical protein n=1 Tax=Escherichia coli TaxID=562 RepID=UPI0028DE9417